MEKRSRKGQHSIVVAVTNRRNAPRERLRSRRAAGARNFLSPTAPGAPRRQPQPHPLWRRLGYPGAARLRPYTASFLFASVGRNDENVFRSAKPTTITPTCRSSADQGRRWSSRWMGYAIVISIRARPFPTKFGNSGLSDSEPLASVAALMMHGEPRGPMPPLPGTPPIPSWVVDTKRRFQTPVYTLCCLFNYFISFTGHAVSYGARPCPYRARLTGFLVIASTGLMAPASVWVTICATRINELIGLFSRLDPATECAQISRHESDQRVKWPLSLSLSRRLTMFASRKLAHVPVPMGFISNSML